MKAYQVIATLGPASQNEETWRAMLSAGGSGFRLNTSHLSLAELDAWMERLRAFLKDCEPLPALVLDLQGSKWRLGELAPGELAQGQRVELIYAASSDRPGVLPVPHADFFQAANLSNKENDLDIYYPVCHHLSYNSIINNLSTR